MGITIHSKKLIEDKYPEIFLTFSGFSGFPLEKKKKVKCVLVLSKSILMNGKKRVKIKISLASIRPFLILRYEPKTDK